MTLINRQRKTVEIPQDRPLKEKEYQRIKKYAYNTTLWYAQRYPSGKSKLIDRLIRKGYPVDGVMVESEDGEEVNKDVIAEVIQSLQSDNDELMNEHNIAENVISSYLRSGKNVKNAWFKCMQKGVSRTVFDEVVEKYVTQEDINDALDIAGRKILRSSTYKKKEKEFEKRNTFLKSMMTKGFDFSDASQWYEDNKDE